MTFEEALAAPGRKVQVSGEENDGRRVVTIYRVAADGAKELAGKMVPVAEHAAVVAELKARGCELADSEFLTNVVWIINGDSVEAYDSLRKHFAASGDRATLVDGRVVERSDIGSVFSWADDDYEYRGIKAVLRSGEEVELVTELSLAATGDPTYNRNDLLMDTGWCTKLGRAIASWAGTTYEDKI